MAKNPNTALQDRAREVPEVAVHNAPLECGTLGTDFERLSGDVIVSLTRQLKITDYLSFRRVCKKFHSVAPIPVTARLENYTASSPWLMFFSNDKSTWKLVDPINNSLHYMNILPHLKGDEVVLSSRDGLIMRQSGMLAYYQNPFSSDSKKLPFPNVVNVKLESMAYSSFPGSSDSVTIGIVNGLARTQIYCFHSADLKCICRSVEDTEEPYPAYGSPIYFDEAFYVLDQFGCAGRLKLQKSDETLWCRMMRSETMSQPFYASYLVECNNKLLIVSLGHVGEQVQVFQVNSKECPPRKVEVDSLGEHTIFVSSTSCFGVVAPILEMANRIYFPRFQGEDILYYSLDTRKYHAVGSDESFDDFYFSREMLNAAWIFPTW